MASPARPPGLFLQGEPRDAPRDAGFRIVERKRYAWTFSAHYLATRLRPNGVQTRTDRFSPETNSDKIGPRRFVRDLRHERTSTVNAYLRALRLERWPRSLSIFLGSAAFFFFYRDRLADFPLEALAWRTGRGVPPDLGHLDGQLRPQRDRRPAVRRPPSDQEVPAARPGGDQDGPLRRPRDRPHGRLPRPGQGGLRHRLPLFAPRPPRRRVRLQRPADPDQGHSLPGLDLGIGQQSHPLPHRLVRLRPDRRLPPAQPAPQLVGVRQFPDGGQAAVRVPLPQGQGRRLPDRPTSGIRSACSSSAWRSAPASASPPSSTWP